LSTPVRTAGKRGRRPKRPAADRFPLRFVHDYVSLPAPSYPIDVSGGITAWGMCANGPDPTCTTYPDGLGDCGFAGRQHNRMAKAACFSETETWETSNQLAAEYLAYDHGQDDGVVVADVLLAWYRAGKILAFAPVDHANPAAVDSAMQAFHGVIVGVELTGDADDLFSEGEPWTTANGETPDPDDGHVIVKVKADGQAIDEYVTWGALQPATLGWSVTCTQEVWAVVTSEDEVTPAELAAMRADIDALGGHDITGPPTPAPSPSPEPSPDDLLDEFAELVREVAASAEKDVTELLAWLASHGR